MKENRLEYFKKYGLAFVKRIANIKDDKQLCKELEIDFNEYQKNGIGPFIENVINYCKERIINLNYVFGTNYERRIIL